ncbi:hypothetical protein ILUMI_16408 [Ignelater luminosus]|uniref:Uncharacterized protein n=1 Tax=Ignelater luminosus TaxID=2038154 RepID=A0A8K0CUH1_IGNLU|nr:hypothetical protein ILUMI_16408 [Ignelater luminosus]
MLFRIERCKSQENLDTCELFHVFRMNDYCNSLKSSSLVWESFFGSFQPPWKCPFKKVSCLVGISTAVYECLI